MGLADEFRHRLLQIESEEKAKVAITREFADNVWQNGVLPLLNKNLEEKLRKKERKLSFWLEEALDLMGLDGEGWAKTTPLEKQKDLAFFLLEKLRGEGFKAEMKEEYYRTDRLNGGDYLEVKIHIEF